MADTTVAPQSAASTEEKKPVPGNIVSRGKATLATPTNATQTDENNSGAAGQSGATAELTEEQKLAAAEAEKNKLPELSDEQFKELLKGKGIELDDKGIEGLKEKLKPAASTAPEPTAEEKAAAEAALEKRMLDHFTSHGGTVENFVALKQIASADLKELSASEIRREMKANDFSEEEINIVLKERYYQINPEELVRDEDNETEEEFAARKKLIEKKIAYGSKKLESKSSHIKKSAEDALSNLRAAIQTEDLLKAEEVKHSTRVDELTATLPRKLSIELGEGPKGQKLPTVEIDVTDEIISEVNATLKNINDAEKSKQFLYNTDNSFNLQNIAQVMIRNKILEAALQKTYLEGDKVGAERQVAEFEKIFPGRTAAAIGVGGNNSQSANARKGHIVSRGQPEPVRR